MFSLILDRILKGKFKDDVIRLSFFTFQGLLGSVVINDVFRILFGDFREKEALQYGIATIVVVAPSLSDKLMIFGKKSNNYALGFGLGIGTMIACMSAKLQPKEEEKK